MGNVSTSTHKKQPDSSDAKLPKRNADSRPKPKEDDDLAKAEKAYKATRSRYGGRLRNLQDVENRIANATWGDHVTGNVAKWEKEAQAERAQAKREQKAMLEQKAQMQKAREAKVRAEKAKAEASKATDPKIKKELQIKAQKEEDKVSDHVKSAKAARKKGNEESKKYLNDMKEANEPKPAKHERATKAHEDVKQDKQKVRNEKVDAPTSANTKRLADALDKQQKSTDSVVAQGGGIKTNVEDTNSRAQNSIKTDVIASTISPVVGMIMNGGMSTALLQERDNDRKLLEANNKIAAENLRNEQKLKETIKTVQEYEARAAKYKKLGDDQEAARYSKMAKELTDQALSETKTIRTVRREETKSAGTNYIKEQKKVTEQYEAVAGRNDKAAITMRVTRDVAVVAGATIATGGAATAIAATGAGTLAVVTGATAVGTLSGSTIGAVSNTAGAVSSGTTGYKTWGDAWKDAGSQTVQDAKSSFYSSAGTALGIGVAGKLASPIIGKVGEQGGRLALGSITAATGQTATTAMNLGEHFYNTSEEFNKLKAAGQIKESDRAQYFADRGLSPQAMGKSLAISFGTGVVGGNIGARSDLIREGATSVWGKVGATTLDTGGSAVIGLTTAYIQNDGKMTYEDFANEAAGAVTSVMQGNIGSKIGKHAANNSNAPDLKLETFNNNAQEDLPIAAMRVGATLPPPMDITPTQPQKSIARIMGDLVNQPKAVASTHTGALGVVAYNKLNNEPGAKPARVIIMSPSGGDGITPAGIAYQLFRNRFAPNEHTGNNIGLQKVTVVCTPEQKPMLESALRREMETNRPQAFATAGGTTRLEDYVDLVTARPGEVVNVEVHRSPLATEEAKAKTPASEKFAIKIPSEGSEKPTALVSKINPNDGSLQKVKRELHYKPEQQPELKPQSIVPVEGRPQLHAIGTGGLITPEPNSCLILTNGKIGSESRTFIIDDGNPNGFARSRGLYDLNPNNVEALTHFHADHTQGMMERIKIRSDSGVKNTLIVNKYTKAQVESYFTTTYGRKAGQKIINSIDFKVLEPADNDTRSISYKPIQIGNTKIEAIRTRHNYGSEGRLEAVAYKYTFDNDGIKTSFVTTGDTQFGSRYLAAYSDTVKTELDNIKNSKDFTTEDFDRTKKLVTTYFDEDGRAKFNDASNKSPSEQKAFIQDYLENELKTVAKHTERNEKFDRELATFCKPADDVSSHLVYLDAGGAARPGFIPAVDTAHASGMVAPIHMGASDAQHLMHLVGVNDQRINFIAGHTSSTAKIIGGTTAGSEGGNRSYDLRANKSIDWTSGYADGVTRVSSDGARAVYYADEKSLQSAYEGILADNAARSSRPINESVSEVNNSKGVIAFYDRRTGAIHSIDPKFKGATKEARILTGALLRHEYTHHLQETNGVKINEVEAFKSMFDYVDRVNAKDPSRQFELRITNDNVQIHELKAGQTARRLSEAEIQRIVDHNYKNVDGAVAPMKLDNDELRHSIDNVKETINGQFLHIDERLVTNILNKFGPDTKTASEVMGILSHAGSFRGLENFAKNLKIRGNDKILTLNRGSFADCIGYFSGSKNLLNGVLVNDKSFVSELHPTANTFVFIDDVMIDHIRQNPEFADKLTAENIKIASTPWIDNGLSVFRHSDLDTIPSTISSVLDRVKAYKIKHPNASTDTAMNMIAKEDLRAKLIDAGVSPHTADAIIGKDLAIQPTPSSKASKIADALNGNQYIDDAAIERYLEMIPEQDRMHALNILMMGADVHSPSSLASVHQQQYKKILELAESKGIHPSKILFLTPEGLKSYSVAALGFRHTNDIHASQFINVDQLSTLLDPSKTPFKGRDSMIVILDDVAGSGGTLGQIYKSLGTQGHKFLGEIVIAPTVTTASAENSFMERCKLDAKLNYIPGYKASRLEDNPYLKSLPDGVQFRIRAEFAKHLLGYNQDGLMMAFPYMSPNNNNGVFVSSIAPNVTHNGRGIKPPSTGMPKSDIVGQERFIFRVLNSNQQPSYSATKR